MEQDFEMFFKANERRIHYQIHRLGIHGEWYEEFYTEGIVALWNAYREYDKTKGDIGTFLNYRIRYRLIDHIRKRKREEEHAEAVIEKQKVEMTNGTRTRHSETPLPDIENIPIKEGSITHSPFWQTIRKQLTDNQWKWVKYFIIADLSIQEIMEIENVTQDAVKGWGRAVRRKLRNDETKKLLEGLLEDD